MRERSEEMQNASPPRPRLAFSQRFTGVKPDGGVSATAS